MYADYLLLGSSHESEGICVTEVLLLGEGQFCEVLGSFNVSNACFCKLFSIEAACLNESAYAVVDQVKLLLRDLHDRSFLSH